MIAPTLYHTLRAFRAAVYAALGARRDALFEALDAATTVGPVPALPYWSLTALHRRRWGSLYAALAAGRLEVPALRALVGRCWTMASRSTRWIRASGRATTRRPAPSAATITRPRGSPPAS